MHFNLTFMNENSNPGNMGQMPAGGGPPTPLWSPGFWFSGFWSSDGSACDSGSRPEFF